MARYTADSKDRVRDAVDFDSLEDKAVTIRDRDSTEQVRVPIESLLSELTDRISD